MSSWSRMPPYAKCFYLENILFSTEVSEFVLNRIRNGSKQGVQENMCVCSRS